MEIRPRLTTGDFNTKAYNQDIRKFGRVLDILNKNNKEEGEYTSEDLFSYLLKKGIENMPDIQESLEKEPLTKKRGTRKTKNNQNLN